MFQKPITAGEQKGEPMRLIDADSLETHEQLEPFGNGNYEYVEVVYKDDIDNALTFEPEPKRGKWIAHNPHRWGLGIVFECSECGEEIECESSNFCPNCGADMRTRTCEGCKYDSLSWDEEPCDSCTSGDMRGEENEMC